VKPHQTIVKEIPRLKRLAETIGFPYLGSLQYLAMSSSPQPDPIADLLKRSKTIAVVGLSNRPLRPSHGVSAYMQTNGYRIIPVNPEIKGALGEKAYASLLDVPEKIDIVNVFRRPEFVEEVVDPAIQLRVPAIWMQEEVINEKAAEKARKAGIFVVMDHCILKEHKARFG
jgi:predicted CoA-binding protein